MSVLDAVIGAGGLSRQADGNAALILRRTDAGHEEIPVRLADLVRDGDSTANVALLPGDVIIIPEGFLDGVWRVTYGFSASQTVSVHIAQAQNQTEDRRVGKEWFSTGRLRWAA